MAKGEIHKWPTPFMLLKIDLIDSWGRNQNFNYGPQFAN